MRISGVFRHNSSTFKEKTPVLLPPFPGQAQSLESSSLGVTLLLTQESRGEVRNGRQRVHFWERDSGREEEEKWMSLTRVLLPDFLTQSLSGPRLRKRVCWRAVGEGGAVRAKTKVPRAWLSGSRPPGRCLGAGSLVLGSPHLPRVSLLSFETCVRLFRVDTHDAASVLTLIACPLSREASQRHRRSRL